VKVSDFNLSKVMYDSSRSTSLQAMNPRWLPPEVLSGGEFTMAADVFAFGVIAWELMTWELPWGSSNPWGIVGCVSRGQRLNIPEASALPGPASGEWSQLQLYTSLIERCWAQDPAERPTFEQIMNELQLIDPTVA
jgi:serine/threonine protein kinase